MRDRRGNTSWTYRSSDGQTEQVYNPDAGGVVPDFIVLKDGETQATLDQDSGTFRGRGYTPPAGTRMVKPWAPPPIDPDKPVDVALGWPGMTEVA